MKASILAVLAAATGFSSAATLILTDSTPGRIPDGSAAGLARSLTFNEPTQTVISVEVSVHITAAPSSTAFLGDLYLYLTDGVNLVVLANRPGQAAGLLGGYADDQPMNVSFSDLAGDDFHTYRVPVTGSSAVPLGAPLTGSFEPDGRTADPGSVVTSDPRTSMLAQLAGSEADRTFSLFAADLSTGNAHQLESWSVTLTTTVVPETGSTLPGVVAVALALLGRRRGRRTG